MAKATPLGVSSSSSSSSSSSAPLYSFGVQWPQLNDGISYTDVIKPSHHATSLIGFYSEMYSNSAPVQGWIQRIKNGQVTVDGRVVTDPDSVLRIGSKIVYNRLPWKEPYAPYLLEVLYEDDDMIALNKPSGLQVLPGGLFQQRTVLRQLQWQESKCRPSSRNSRSAANGKQHPVPVHRLGRGTSGILLCAKTKPAKACLAAYFADGTSSILNKRICEMEHVSRKISKFYRALVNGILDKDEVVIDQPIGVMDYPGVAKGLYVASISGKPALSKVKVLERNAKGNQTLVQVEIHSGRPHQIRIHLAFIGHPLVGDPLYVSGGHPKCLQSLSEDDTFADDGGYPRPVNPVPGDCGYYLHAHCFVLCQPSMADKVIEVIAPIPSMLQTQEGSCQIDS